MAFKVVILLSTLMAANAVLLPSGISVLQPTLLNKPIEPADASPKYGFSYQVNDQYTGDVKSQEEARNGDVVKGAYSLIDADGLQRVVQYTSDDINGFNAFVARTPIGKQIAATSTVPIIKTLQPTLIKSVVQPALSPLITSSSIGLPLTSISGLSPLIKTSGLGVSYSSLGLGSIYG